MSESSHLSLRIAKLLAQPLDDIRSLGAVPARDHDPLGLFGRDTSPVRALAAVTEQLIPMINSFRTPQSSPRRWWTAFTGAELEREVTYFHACAGLEQLAASGVGLARKVETLLLHTAQEEQHIAADMVVLGETVAAAQAVLGEKYAATRQEAWFKDAGADYWSRFSRRAENLNSLLTSMQMTQAQFGLAKAQAQTALDRFSEVVDVLIPLWRQRTGMDLFSRNNATPEAL